MFITESPKVIERALDGGYEPVSFLAEKGQLAEAEEILDRMEDVPIYVAPDEILTKLRINRQFRTIQIRYFYYFHRNFLPDTHACHLIMSITFIPNWYQYTPNMASCLPHLHALYTNLQPPVTRHSLALSPDLSSSAGSHQDNIHNYKSRNNFWGKYGTDKIKAENALLERVPDGYILRPPYLYGSMDNVYREAFVFDCAMADRKFYLPEAGEMKLQFFHVEDLCRLMEVIITKCPTDHILNVGNEKAISIRDWVIKCYACFDKVPEFVSVPETVEQA